MLSFSGQALQTDHRDITGKMGVNPGRDLQPRRWFGLEQVVMSMHRVIPFDFYTRWVTLDVRACGEVLSHRPER